MEWVIPAVALLLLIWGAFVHRRLVSLRETATQVWSDVDAGFRQRQELIPRLLQKIQGHLDMEGKPVRALNDARRAAGQAQTPDAIGKAEATLDAAIDRVLVLAAGKPELAADAGFRRLQSNLPEMEKRLAALRRHFNDSVEDYNAARLGFPGAFLAYVVNFPLLERLGVPKAAAAPQVRTSARVL